MQAETRMQKSRAGIRRDATQLLAYAQGERPFLLPHQMMQAELEHLRPILVARLDRIKLGEGFAPHAQLCVAAGRLQLPFELHASYLANTAPKGSYYFGQAGA
jgi:hypothetical protein